MLIKKSIPIFAFLFITIFEPPFLPLPLIYLQAVFDFIYIFTIFINSRNKIKLRIFVNSGMNKYLYLVIMLAILLTIDRLVDIIFFNGNLSSSNWLKSINQLIVLTFIEFVNISIIIRYLHINNFKFDDLLNMIVNAGVLQGIISIFAFMFPRLRTILLTFAGDIYTNSWMLERRGYGFSLSLLDGFGFGMGLIAGIIIINLEYSSLKNTVYQLIKLFIVIFSISVNSRTGLIITAVAVILKISISKDLRSTLIKLPISIIIFYIIILALIPLINLGMGSTNINVNWICSDIGGLIKAFFPSANINTTAVQAQMTNNTYYNLISSVEFPDSVYQMLFGMGWQVYEGSRIGYRSDNGFINMIWMFGFIGTIFYYLYNLYIHLKILFKVKNSTFVLLIFNFISLLIYSIKGRPLGYSSGIVIFYLVIFSATYFIHMNIKDGGVNDTI